MERLAKKFAYYIAVKENPNVDFFSARNRSNGLYIGSRMEGTREFNKEFEPLINIKDVANAITGSSELHDLELSFTDWILSHNYNKIKGLELYEPDYSEGATQAFDSFYFISKVLTSRIYLNKFI